MERKESTINTSRVFSLLAYLSGLALRLVQNSRVGQLHIAKAWPILGTLGCQDATVELARPYLRWLADTSNCMHLYTAAQQQPVLACTVPIAVLLLPFLFSPRTLYRSASAVNSVRFVLGTRYRRGPLNHKLTELKREAEPRLPTIHYSIIVCYFISACHT